MFVPFANLPSHARVWVFQANRALTADEVSTARERLYEFTEQWSVHGMPLNTSFDIRYNRFIILAADESEQSASGCSIDSSVRALKELEQLISVQLFDRTEVAFRSGGEVIAVPLRKLKENFSNGILAEDALAFNNLVETKAALEERWLLPARETWLKRYISTPLAKVK